MKNSVLRFPSKIGVILALSASVLGIARAELPTPGEVLGRFHQKNPAQVTDQSRSDSYNDFMRVLWVSPTTPVTNIAGPRKRGFFTASTFLEPPVTVDELLRLVGNRYRPGLDFAVMRCKPLAEQRSVVQPILATWPNVFPAIASDLGGPDCTGLTAGETQICKIASEFHDRERKVYTRGLRYTLRLGAKMFKTPESTDALDKDYGIFPAFTGLGFTVQASSTPDGMTVPMTTGEVLRNSVVPEYLLKNADLADANCRCVRVSESESLHTEPVDPEFVWKHGKLVNGACRPVSELRTSAFNQNLRPASAR